MKNQSQTRIRTSFVVTTCLMLLSAGSMLYRHMFAGVVALVIVFALLEIILLNCKSPMIVSRVGGIPWIIWIYPLTMIALAVSMINGSQLLSSEMAYSIGMGILTSVIISLGRWFHRHYPEVPRD